MWVSTCSGTCLSGTADAWALFPSGRRLDRRARPKSLSSLPCEILLSSPFEGGGGLFWLAPRLDFFIVYPLYRNHFLLLSFFVASGIERGGGSQGRVGLIAVSFGCFRP